MLMLVFHHGLQGDIASAIQHRKDSASMFVDARKVSEDLVFRHEMNMDIIRAAETLRIRFSRTAEQPSMNPA
jgi:hypothetical protein